MRRFSKSSRSSIQSSTNGDRPRRFPQSLDYLRQMESHRTQRPSRDVSRSPSPSPRSPRQLRHVETNGTLVSEDDDQYARERTMNPAQEVGVSQKHSRPMETQRKPLPIQVDDLPTREPSLSREPTLTHKQHRSPSPREQMSNYKLHRSPSPSREQRSRRKEYRSPSPSREKTSNYRHHRSPSRSREHVSSHKYHRSLSRNREPLPSHKHHGPPPLSHEAMPSHKYPLSPPPKREPTSSRKHHYSPSDPRYDSRRADYFNEPPPIIKASGADVPPHQRDSGLFTRYFELGSGDPRAFRHVVREPEDDEMTQTGEETMVDEEKPREPSKVSKDPNIVDWDGPNDPGNPKNWGSGRRIWITLCVSSLTFVITFASSVFSTATEVVSKKFHVSQEVTTLGTSLFVLGFAVGPLIWGPASELYGRTRPLFIGFIGMVIFQIPVAVATNLETIMLCRFIGGFLGSAPLAIVGGLLADIWDPVNRGVAIVAFAAATFVGPVAGPIMGGFITQSYLGWRWTAWMTLIMGALFGGISLCVIPETYAPLILSRRAARLRFETQNWALRSTRDEQQVDFGDIVNRYLLRPFEMLAKEPILVMVTLYMGLVYGILYLFFEAYPISFQEQRGWNLGVGALPFIGIIIGVAIGSGFITILTKTRFKRKFLKDGHVEPEERLLPMIVGAFILPIGLFWFAWTSNPHITWVPQALAGIPIGGGILMIFIQGLNYIIDVYLMHANSAIAANTMVRSFAGAGFPLFAAPMFHNLGVPWATSLLAFLTVAMVPVPILFLIYGKKVRKLSKYSPTA